MTVAAQLPMAISGAPQASAEQPTIAQPLCVPARDGFSLGATWFKAATESSSRWLIINSATAVPQRYYRHFASYMSAAGFNVLTFDYRGMGLSRPQSLRGFRALASDWAELDMAGVIDWVHDEHRPEQLIVVGHSIGGQLMGLVDNPHKVDAMLTVSSQSGYWRLQGGEQKWAVLAHMHLTFPVLSRLFGYMPWSKLGSSEDMPQAAALQWAAWCRHPDYVLGDARLPLQRYQHFGAPVLAYSVADDKWGTARAVDAMMRAYPQVERRHIQPQTWGLKQLGHFGYFRPSAQVLWSEALEWLDSLPQAQRLTGVVHSGSPCWSLRQ